MFGYNSAKRYLVGILISLLLIICMIDQATSETHDGVNMASFCQGEYFKAACGQAEVILITKASYGRVRISRCVKENFGYVGCSHDVLGVMDSLCSGRHDCLVRVLDENFPNIKPCHEDLKSYLEVTFQCLKAMPRHVCNANTPLTLKTPSGYLASIVATEKSCGTDETPWVIEAFPGQKINITLIDFGPTINDYNVSSFSASRDGFSKVCRVYATLTETHGARSVTICGGGRRHRSVYTSHEHRVEVKIISSKSTKKPVHFLLYYQATGCPDVESPLGGWMKRNERVALFGCSESSISWQAKCVGDTWVGENENCSIGTMDIPATKMNGFSMLSLPLGISIVVVVVLALIIGLVTLGIGVFCLRRKTTGEEKETFKEKRNVISIDCPCAVAQSKQRHMIVSTCGDSNHISPMKDGVSPQSDYDSSTLGLLHSHQGFIYGEEEYYKRQKSSPPPGVDLLRNFSMRGQPGGHTCKKALCVYCPKICDDQADKCCDRTKHS